AHYLDVIVHGFAFAHPILSLSRCRAARSASRRAGTTIRLECPANSLTVASMAVRSAQVGGEAGHIGLAEARSALAWWLDAGVDIAVQEQPRDWLKPPAPRTKPS